MVNLLVAAAVAAATPALNAPATPAEPAMFRVQDADTTIYLFGTFHALDGNVHWLEGGVRQAFEQSDELVLETLIPEPSRPPAQVSYQIRPPSVTPSGSFLATTRMALSAGQSQGMQVDQGADMVLRHRAEAEGKQVQGLETLEFQLNMFNKMPAAPAGAAAAAAPGTPGRSSDPKSMQTLSRTMAAMQSAWKRGDQSVFAALLDQLKAGSPDTYKMMFTDRNDRWADWIRARMRSPGTVFVAVGAGHLVGNDSVLVRLAERGLESRRVY